MTSLSQSPADKTLVSLAPVWTVTVTGIGVGATSRTLFVSRSGVGQIFSWIEGVVVTDPTFLSSVSFTGTDLTVILTLATPPTAGEYVGFLTSYSDTGTPGLSLTRDHIAGEVTTLAQNPAPQSQDVSRRSAVLFDASTSLPLMFYAARIYVDDVEAFATTYGFSRPDYEGQSSFSADLLAVTVQSRRSFDQEQTVPVAVEVDVKTAAPLVVTHRVEWVFTTAYERTPITDSTLLNTAVDRPAKRGLVEMFRTAGLAAVRAPTSSASSAVLLFYAVQQSSLSSLTSYLPGASLLAPEAALLLPRDIVGPETAYEKFDAVLPFFEIYLSELVTMGLILPEEEAYLGRAWASNVPADRVGAVAASLLYAFPVAL
jgi:hypothetical protein